LRRELFFDHALLPSGWARDVRITVADGTIAAVTEGALHSGADRVSGIAVPGLPNLHCHAFQRGMAGLAERRGPTADSFWTWREVMYHFLQHLSPDDVEAIAAFAYLEMLEAGFTTVGEFHYLHHDVDGRPYANPGEMAERIAGASAQTRIGLTLLPSFYAYGGFGGAAPAPGQRRFINDPERFLDLVRRARVTVARLPQGRVGIAPHSLRAVTPATLRTICQATPEGPIHIHAAEQLREVEDCVAALGRRPVEWLLENAALDERWCVIHATHTTPAEIAALAASRAVVGLCPLTEASLGDGIFDGAAYLAARGRFGIGTDSNIQIDAAAELRQLEYGQRLARRARNVMAVDEGESTGRRARRHCNGQSARSPSARVRMSCCSTTIIRTSPRVMAINGSTPGFSSPDAARSKPCWREETASWKRAATPCAQPSRHATRQSSPNLRRREANSSPPMFSGAVRARLARPRRLRRAAETMLN
jgi:formimidoylglutamate deiminase